MRKSLVVLMLPVLFASSRVDSTEIPFALSNQEKYELNQKNYQSNFGTVPQNPNVSSAVFTYLDVNLTEADKVLQPNQPFEIVAALVNNKQQQIFQLSNNTFILADSSIIFDDVILEETSSNQVYWTKKDFIVYTSPIGNQAEKKNVSIKAYQSIAAKSLFKTYLGTFAKIDEKTYIKLSDLSDTDNRIEAVQTMLDKKYNSSKYGIYVKQLTTGRTAGVNQEQKMYAASISKLPVLYYAQEQIDNGKYNLTQDLQYRKEVMNFPGSYSAEGSGVLSKTADDKNYEIKDLIDKISKLSDNAASNLLAYYTTNQFDSEYYQKIDAITGKHWDMKSRQASPQMAGLMMEAIYEQNGYALESLTGTNFDNQRIARNIPVPIAHKIGDAYDFRHDVAVIYADSPFILSIFTNQSDYDTISTIANDIYSILK
ncbi:serine hydrolase [Streptococcus sp. X16XC17]|uniref:serine hydrolase n=1 Tax=unclassified Streptococcus TaxID=2608887 RepID=UPI00066FC3B5|nr:MULTISPECIES: serine hydrolase [unclassified Streptococcus]TCD45491.1 serine hydrolase [Streptococcus sp. X16XC17]